MQRDHFAVVSNVLDAIHRVVGFVLGIAIVLCLLYFAVSLAHAPRLSEFTGIAQMHRFGDPLATRFAGAVHAPAAKRYVPLVLALASYLLILAFDRFFAAIHRALWSRAPLPATQTAVLAADSEEAREELVRKYREIEQALKETKRKRCTFLSIDVVGSTQMKEGEDEIAITASFKAYEDLLKRTFLINRAWKQAWTPDGAMICFLDRERALSSAKTILEKLDPFNARDNKLKAPFHVRCGINEGDVAIFEDTNLEKIADQAIDVAGHMQKYAAPDSIWLSEELYNALDDKSGFGPEDHEVDGLRVYAWKAPVTAA
jgi:class 3 adenylate cyclase